jgi:hypothetical protein
MLVRAFALDIQATDGNIIAIDGYLAGDNNGTYGIFPGAFAAAPIAVDPATGLVNDWGVVGYTPVAPEGDPDALGAIPGPGITVEMGSLYTDNGPAATGVLCVITVDENVTEVCVTGNAIRGNVVLEDASEATTNVDVTPVCTTDFDGGGCLPSDDVGYDFWVSQGKPDCWCYARQCYGDADGHKQGNIIVGDLYVSTDDIIILAAAWQVAEAPKGPGIASIENGICADFNHDKQGNILVGDLRVSTDDIILLAASWQVPEPPKGPGVPTDCVPIPVEPPPKP